MLSTDFRTILLPKMIAFFSIKVFLAVHCCVMRQTPIQTVAPRSLLPTLYRFGNKEAGWKIGLLNDLQPLPIIRKWV